MMTSTGGLSSTGRCVLTLYAGVLCRHVDLGEFEEDEPDKAAVIEMTDRDGSRDTKPLTDVAPREGPSAFL
jgi:hypothetical protein